MITLIFGKIHILITFLIFHLFFRLIGIFPIVGRSFTIGAWNLTELNTIPEFQVTMSGVKFLHSLVFIEGFELINDISGSLKLYYDINCSI
jgi:hypothetical protein